MDAQGGACVPHAPPRSANANIKVIQIIRNPKDVLVSLYHFYRMNKGLGLYLGTWDDFFELIRNDQLVYGDLFPQVAEWYSFNKGRENSMILVYEDMKVDLKGNLIKLNQFLGKKHFRVNPGSHSSQSYF